MVLCHAMNAGCIGGSKGRASGIRAPGPNSFNFMQFLGKNWPLANCPVPIGNPGSVTGLDGETLRSGGVTKILPAIIAFV